MDMLGVGDAAEPPAGRDIAEADWMFRREGVQEVCAALDLLEAQGHPRVVVLGICSGAHHAFQAALRDPRIVGLTLANLPAFDRAAGGAPALDGGPPPGERKLLRRPRMLMRRILAELDFWAAEGLGIESRLNRPGRWMRELSARGVSLLLAYSARDRGLRELRAHFGRDGRRLADLTLVRRITLPGTDHSLTPRAMRDAFMALVLEELARHHGVPDATPRPTRAVADATSAMPALRTA
jgi:pimeloyl-ACP methyl ester carboxylesterase